MAQFKKILALVLAVCVICTAGAISVTAAVEDDAGEAVAAGGITVHIYNEGGTPNIYYWNSLPNNITTTYPGPKMTAEGDNYYRYSFSNVTKINFMTVTNGKQGEELSRESAGEWWYKDDRWYDHYPQPIEWERSDLREDSIYFLITTRFYDGDKSNNVHCWEDKKANNPDSDTPWRGDFKGLIERLDYIKALGFTAVWITPVVENCSGYDYHGYHAFDFAKVDPRYESKGVTFQDVIDAAHKKGLKIIQDVVWNHTGNFGEKTLCPMFNRKYSSVQDLGSIDSLEINPNGPLAKYYSNYNSLNPSAQYGARLACMKEDSKDPANNYHHGAAMDWETFTEQTGQIADDCVDVNTENPTVAKYLTDSYMDYANMGVDAFRLDTEKHISRWTLNHAFFPVFNKIENFYIFGEVCARVRDVWNHGIMASSCPFYGWKETESKWTSNWSKTDQKSNNENAVKHYQEHSNSAGALTSSNATLNGMNYHTPDYSKSNRTGTIDFTMHWSFGNAYDAYSKGLEEDKYFNDSTWNVMYVDSHDYGPDGQQDYRYRGGAQAWAENMNLMFTFRGIPCIFYGTETEFKKDCPIDVGPNKPLEQTGRAYFGTNLEGSVTASDFGKYTASGKVSSTLSAPLANHMRQLNLIRRAVPALQKGQYKSVGGGGMSFVRRYTANGVDSLACVAISGGGSFSGLPNGKYIDAVTGDVKTVSGGTLNVSGIGKGNMRVYVCCASGFKGISGKIGTNGAYLK